MASAMKTREWRGRNAARISAQNVARNAAKKREVRAFVRAAKSHPCMDCGRRFDPVCMDFDHRPGETKLANIAAINTSLGAVQREIAKCDLVCACCHRLRTKTRWENTTRVAKATEVKQQLSLLDT